MKKVIIEVEDELHRMFKIKLSEDEKTMKDVITEFIEKYTGDNEAEKEDEKDDNSN